MARKSKSSENKENSENSPSGEATETFGKPPGEPGESPPDEPGVIEAEAVDPGAGPKDEDETAAGPGPQDAAEATPEDVIAPSGDTMESALETAPTDDDRDPSAADARPEPETTGGEPAGDTIQGARDTDGQEDRDASAVDAQPDADRPDETPEQAEEPAAEAEPDRAPEAGTMNEPPAPVPLPEPPRGRNAPSLIAMVFGGLVAGGIGYFAASFAPPPSAPAPDPIDTTVFSEGIAANSEQISQLSGRIEELAAAPAATEPADQGALDESLAAINQRLDDAAAELATLRDELTGANAALGDRISALEATGPAPALPGEDELANLRSQIDAMTAEAENRLAEAQARAAEIEQAAAAARQEAEARAAAAEETAARQAAIVELRAAVENGAAFTDVLSQLGDVPEVLSANAETGVASMAELQQAFPEAARAALAEGQTVPEDAGAAARLTAFLKRQTNARSLRPQEGDSTDAVLSRAQAALDSGDLGAALTELDALSDASKAAMAGWLDRATTRLAALDAVRDLTATTE